jgi:hypothetical protein
MAFETQVYGNDSSVSHNICLIDRAQTVDFSAVALSGPFATANGDTAAEALNCVQFSSSGSLICTQISFDQCQFTGASYGINTDEQVQGCTVKNSVFDTLSQGIVLGSASPVNGGPKGFRITENLFDNVYNQGIVIDSVSLNLSAYNTFLDVANHYLGNAYAAAPVIDIRTTNNVSIGDMFQRTTAYSGTYPRITINNGINIAFDGAAQTQQGTYVRQTGASATVANDAINQVIFTFNATAIRAVQINYTVVRDTGTRTGVFTIVAGTDNAGTGLTSNDTGYQNSVTGVTFGIQELAGQVSWLASTTNTGIAATLHYSVTKLA